MFVPYVIDTVTKIKYVVDHQSPLGEGATAKVWKGIDEQDPSKPPVAIKIARRGTSEALLAEFWEELSILEKLSQTEAKRNVPWAHKGESPEATDAAIIIMELIPDAWQLTRHAQAAGGKLPEELALSVGFQYARLLEAVHSKDLNLTTRGDRKATDLRCNDSLQPRLVVLDWNRAKEIPAEAQVSVREELIRQDLRGFGQLWSGLVLGHRVTSLPSVDDQTDTDWAALTRGFRGILSRALGSRSSWGYQEAGELAEDLQEHMRRFGLSHSDPDQILYEARSLRDEATQTQDPDEQVQLANQVMTLIDLASRAASRGLIDPAQIEPFESWASEQTSAVMQEAVEAIRKIRDRLSLGEYEAAVQLASDITDRLRGRGGEQSRASLRLTRWRIAAQAGVRGNELGTSMRAPTLSLGECISKLEEAIQTSANFVTGDTLASLQFLQSALTSLEQAERNVPDELKETLKPLRMEIDIRGKLVTALKVDRENRTDDARVWYDQAVATWRNLEKSDALYAESLRADLDLLDRKLSEATLETGLDADLKRKSDSFARALGDLAASIRSMGGE